MPLMSPKFQPRPNKKRAIVKLPGTKAAKIPEIAKVIAQAAPIDFLPTRSTNAPVPSDDNTSPQYEDR